MSPTDAAELILYARRRVIETCAAQGVDVIPPAEVLEVAAEVLTSACCGASGKTTSTQGSHERNTIP